MAYRKLVNGDHVRIVNNGVFHGRDAIVIDANDNQSRVQIKKYDHRERTECTWVYNDRLIILDLEVIARLFVKRQREDELYRMNIADEEMITISLKEYESLKEKVDKFYDLVSNMQSLAEEYEYR